MLEFGIVLAVFSLIVLAIYLPAFYRHFAWKQSEKEFEYELSQLGFLYDSSRIVITDRLGEGTSQNSDVKFAEAHKNQSFAMNTVMELLSRMAEIEE